MLIHCVLTGMESPSDVLTMYLYWALSQQFPVDNSSFSFQSSETFQGGFCELEVTDFDETEQTQGFFKAII